MIKNKTNEKSIYKNGRDPFVRSSVLSWFDDVCKRSTHNLRKSLNLYLLKMVGCFTLKPSTILHAKGLYDTNFQTDTVHAQGEYEIHYVKWCRSIRKNRHTYTITLYLHIWREIDMDSL